MFMGVHVLWLNRAAVSDDILELALQVANVDEFKKKLLHMLILMRGKLEKNSKSKAQFDVHQRFFFLRKGHFENIFIF
jgi:hypothetical protein